MPIEKLQRSPEVNPSPSGISTTETTTDAFHLIMNLQSWSMEAFLHNPARFSDKEIQAQRDKLRQKITSKEEALACIRGKNKQDFEKDALFYKALWELMREKRWNR